MRKMALLAIILMLFTCAQAQGTYVVQAKGWAVLVDADGETLIRNADVEALIELCPNALYAAGVPGDYGLFDVAGRRVNSERYEMLEAVDDVVLFRQNGRYGAMDEKGNALIEPEWAQLTYAGDGAFLALQGDLYDDLPDEMISLSIDEDPKDTGSFTANGLHGFRDGRMSFMQSDGLYGFVDALGRQVIPPQWQFAGDFGEGVAVISDDSGMGLIDTGGRIVLAPQYDWIRRGQGLIAAYAGDDGLDVYTADGGELLCFLDQAVEEAEVCGAYVVTRDGDSAQLYDANGACIYEASRSALFYPGLDGQVIAIEESWGEACQRLLDTGGSVVSGLYQRLMPLCGGRYAFLSFSMDDFDDARYGLLSADGSVLLPAEYLEILPVGEDRLALVSEDAVSFADLDGKVLREWPVTETAAPSSEADA